MSQASDIRVSRRAMMAAMTLLTAAGSAFASPVSWADWQSSTGGPIGLVSGSIAAPGGPIAVQYSGEILFAQTSGGTNYWQPDAAYLNATVSNGPPDADIIAITGGGQTINTISFSQPVTDPIMALCSVGQYGVPVQYVFNAPFDVLSYGQGYWGNGPLTELPGNVLEGREGHGTIQFHGTFNAISWNTPTYENWHGFTVGVIPAPGTMGLAAAGGLVALRRRRTA